MGNGEMVNELRRMSAAHEINVDSAMRLMLAAMADMMEQHTKHRHDGVYAPCDHQHGEYAKEKHEHADAYAPAKHSHKWETLAATLTALGALIMLVLAIVLK